MSKISVITASNISLTLRILLARFNGQVLIPFIAASESIGISAQTARNRLSSGTFPIKTELRGARRFVHITDLADYADASRSDSTKPRRGRKTKASKFQTGQGA